MELLGRAAQSVGHLTRKLNVLGSIPGLSTYFRLETKVCGQTGCPESAEGELLPLIQEGQLPVIGESMCTKNWLTASKGGLNLPKKSASRLTDRPDMTLDVYRGCKTTTQQQK